MGGCVTVCLMFMSAWADYAATWAERPIRLMTLEPGHFHAALIQKVMQPDVAERVDVYAAPGPDWQAHLVRIEQFNTRTNQPTHWVEVVHTNDHPLVQMLAERPGNVVVVSGNNQGKIDRLQAIVNHGLSVLADKPWIIEPDEFPKLAATLDAADARGVIAYDAMTQRFEVTCQIPHELVNDPAVFGRVASGSALEPAAEMESVHYLLKEVAGVPLLRPAWFFDINQQGEALADVGTHLVDLVQWTLYPEQAIDYRRDIQLLSAKRWPTVISPAQFARVTGTSKFPPYLRPAIREGALNYYANNSVLYRLRGDYIRLKITWGFEPPFGSKDSELAIFRGTKARIEVRQGPQEKYISQVYVIPARPELHDEVRVALTAKVVALQKSYPGLAVTETAGRFQVLIPDRLRIGHEAHFGLLTRRFLDYVRQPQTLPAWEKPNMLAKYFVTTGGVKLARESIQN